MTNGMSASTSSYSNSPTSPGAEPWGCVLTGFGVVLAAGLLEPVGWVVRGLCWGLVPTGQKDKYGGMAM